MIIGKVKIKDIKKYKEAEYDFSKGVQLILGPNGSGKSTIIECIGWVIFNHLDTKLSNWVRWGAECGSVTVTFISNDIEYNVYRYTDGTYKLLKGKEIIAIGVQDVQIQIKKFLSIDDDASRVFRDIIGVSQELMASQFSMSPSFKKKIFEPLLGIEKYNRMWSSLKPIEGFLKDEMDLTNVEKAKIEGWISSGKDIIKEYEDKEKEIEDVKEDIKNVTEEFLVVDESFKELSSIKVKFDELKKVESDIKVLRGRIGDVEERERDIEDMRTEMETLEESAKKQERIRSKLEDMKEVEKELKKSQEEHQDLSEQYESLRDSIEYAEHQYKDNYEILYEESKRFEKLEKEFKGIEEQRIKLESEMDEINRQLLSAKDGKCPITGNLCPVNVYGDVVKKKEKATDFMENIFYKDYMDLKTKVGQGKNAQLNLQKLIKMKEEADKDMERIADIVNLINKVVNDIDRYDTILSNRPTLMKINDGLGESLERYRELEAVLKNSSIGDSRTKLEGSLNELEDKYKELSTETKDFSVEEFESLKEQHSELKIMVREKKKDKTEKAVELSNLKKKVDILRDKEKEIGKIGSKYDILSRRYELVQASREKLRDIPPEIAKNLLIAINNTANRYHNEIVGACTLEIDENYDVLLSDHKGTRGFKNLSGGEKMTTSVAIRLAFLNEITNIKFLALDEPTASVDDVRKQLLSDIIAKVKGVDQLFIISHDDVFMSQSDNIIEVEP